MSLPRRQPSIKWPVILTIAPAVGSIVGGIPHFSVVVAVAFFASPFLSLIAGINLGAQTGSTNQGQVLHVVLWTTGSFACSLVLQGAGCELTGFSVNRP